jgi:hypothetical protein
MLRPVKSYFAVPHCYDLTHKSAQTHDHRKYRLARDFNAMNRALLSAKPRNTLLAIGAFAIQLRWLPKRKLRRRTVETLNVTKSGRDPFLRQRA